MKKIGGNSGYKIKFTDSAEKQLKAIPKRDQTRIVKRISKLKDDARPESVTKLKGTDIYYRLRQGNWRIVYTIKDKKTHYTCC